jgi:hypothetical protein
MSLALYNLAKKPEKEMTVASKSYHEFLENETKERTK